MSPDTYAEMAVTLFGLGALALGTLAMAVRFLLRHREQLSTTGRQFVADVRRGDGFTFHRGLIAPAPAPRASGARPQPASPPRELHLREWLNLVNHHPDAVPHLFIEGGSGTGKTTLATAILHDRPGPLAIIGVKPDDGWGDGYIFHSAAREPALKQLLAEVRHRLDIGDKSGLTIVLDDFTRLASDHAAAVELYKLIADVGRSLRIRLILIARGRQVKGIGASGESDLLDHFVFLAVRRDHRATLEYDEEAFPIDTRQVADLAQRLPAARFWQPAPTPQPLRESALLSRLLQGSAGEGSAAVPAVLGAKQPGIDDAGTLGTLGTALPHASTLDGGEEEDTGGIPAKLTPEAIQILYNAWGSKSKIAAMLSGKKQKRLAMIDAALEETAAETAH